MENEDIITRYLEKYYTREWENRRICRICDKVLTDDEILEHFKKYHKNIYNDLTSQIDSIKKILESSANKI